LAGSHEQDTALSGFDRMAEGDGYGSPDLREHRGVSEIGNLWSADAIAPLSCQCGKSHRGSAWTPERRRNAQRSGCSSRSYNELQTQIELAASLGFFSESASEELLDLGTRVAKLINALLGVLEPDSSEPANLRRD
jgi:hypothetical protein